MFGTSYGAAYKIELRSLPKFSSGWQCIVTYLTYNNNTNNIRVKYNCECIIILI